MHEPEPVVTQLDPTVPIFVVNEIVTPDAESEVAAVIVEDWEVSIAIGLADTDKNNVPVSA